MVTIIAIKITTFSHLEAFSNTSLYCDQPNLTWKQTPATRNIVAKTDQELTQRLYFQRHRVCSVYSAQPPSSYHPPTTTPTTCPKVTPLSTFSPLIKTLFHQDWDSLFVLEQRYWFSHQSTERTNEKLLTVLDTYKALVSESYQPSSMK